MTEQQPEYITDAMEMMGAGYDQPAAVIDPPRTVKALRDSGLADYKVWGWVKKSAKFISHIKILKGSKLAIWDVISLSIGEDGSCRLSAPEIADLTGYSVSEVRQSIGELDEMGYLSVIRTNGKRNIYKPEFAARGANNPTDNPSKKITPPVVKVERADDPSSPSIENPYPTYKELKELKGANALSQSEIDQANAKVDYILANNQPEKAWAGRELIRADLLHYADWYHEVTGQVMTKRVQSAWWKALGEWKAELLDISDLQTAYTARSAWRTVTSPVELTSDAAAIHALPKVKPESSQYRIGA